MKRKTTVYVSYAIVILLLVLTGLAFSMLMYDDVYVYLDGEVWQFSTGLDLDYLEVYAQAGQPHKDHVVFNYINVTVYGSATYSNNTVLYVDSGMGEVDTPTVIFRWNESSIPQYVAYRFYGLYNEKYSLRTNGVTTHWVNVSTRNPTFEVVTGGAEYELVQFGELTPDELPGFQVTSLLLPLLFLVLAGFMVFSVAYLPFNLAFKMIIIAGIVAIIALNVVPHLFA